MILTELYSNVDFGTLSYCLLKFTKVFFYESSVRNIQIGLNDILILGEYKQIGLMISEWIPFPIHLWAHGETVTCQLCSGSTIWRIVQSKSICDACVKRALPWIKMFFLIHQAFLSWLLPWISPESWNSVSSLTSVLLLVLLALPRVWVSTHSWVLFHPHVPFHPKAVQLVTSTKDLKCNDFLCKLH